MVAGVGEARMAEMQHWIDAQAVDQKGQTVTRKIMLTIFYDDEQPKPWPVMIFNHGRAAGTSDREQMGRAAYTAFSKWWVERGFVVAVPTRMGYGITGGPDVEFTGDCTHKNYPPGYAASASQTLAVLDYMRSWKEVAKDRVLMVGQSFGGATAIKLASMNLPGVVAAINFSGGGGGQPGVRGKPCDPGQLARMFAGYGKTSRIPTLWIYSANDRLLGGTHPREWFDAFSAAGGKGEFVGFPAFGDDGHGIFLKAPEMWRPKVSEFLDANGFRH